MRLGVGGNYVRHLVITVKSMGLGGAMGCSGFKVIIIDGQREGASHKGKTSFYREHAHL